VNDSLKKRHKKGSCVKQRH